MDYDLIVLGGGAGGLSVTSGAAQLGQRVALIERQDKLGGDCLHYGCIPSKSFIKAAKIAQAMRTAEQYGIASVEPTIDFAQVMARVQSVIDTIQVHDDPERFRRYGADILFGRAAFINSNTIQINTQTLRAKRFVIATGSRAIIPQIPGLTAHDYLTNETIFKLQVLPKKLLVVGAGFIGMELAQAFARLGSQVTVVDAKSELFPHLNRDIVAIWQKIYASEGIQFHFATNICQVVSEANGLIAELQNERGVIKIPIDKVLVAVGRTANIENLGLAAAGVSVHPNGIEVDDYLRTTNKIIYAIGDVINARYKFTHIAEYHAGIVIRNAVFRLPNSVNYRVVPAVVYSDPEFAMCGLTLAEAEANGYPAQELSYPMAQVDRAITEGQTEGLAKVVVCRGKILGAQILGINAGELIAELALAMQARLSLKAISTTIHAYPTLAQINRRVINTYYGPKLFNPRIQKLVRLLQKISPW